MRVYITPFFKGEDTGDGGIRRVVEAQAEHLPKFDIEVVESPDDAELMIVHIQLAAHLLKRYPDIPIVVDCHGLYWAEYDWVSEVGNWPLKANKEVLETIRQSDAVIAHSEWVAQAVRRHTLRRVKVVPLGVSLSEWAPRKQNSGYVLWNKTRPDPVCDPRPVAELADAMPEQEIISTFGPEDRPNVTLTGVLPYEEAKAYVKHAGVYLCTSRETFGIGTLEAMAAGVPVVGWNWGGQREIITHKEDGWLCDPGDIDGLVEGITWALENREELSPIVRKSAGRYAWRTVMGRYATFLKSMRSDWDKQAAAPRTSIIVTAHNLAAYLPATLDSVRAQEDQDWECIVVDDASPDDSGEIAERYAAEDSRFRVIHNDTNQYLAGARNTGIEAAHGRFVLPLDSDDMITPSTVGSLATALSNDRSIHIAYGGVLFVNEDGTTPTDYSKGTRNRYTPGHSGWPIPFDFDMQAQQRNCLPYASMFRKSMWEMTGGYRTRCRTAEDADLWLRASSYGFRPKMVTNEDTLVYRNREQSMSRVEGGRDWAGWFPWSSNLYLQPAAAVSDEQSPVHSCDPSLISVVIPVGPSHEWHLWDALDSVDAQTFRQWECIVVNDMGRPFTRALPSWVRVVTPSESRSVGVAAARNAGIAVSRSVTYLPLDADDYLQPRCLQVMWEAYMETGHIIYSDWFDEKEPGQFEVYHAKDYTPELLTKGLPFTVTALTPRAIWEEVGGYDESIFAWEDWAFQLSAADKGHCAMHVAHPLFTYRKYTGVRREENYARFEDGKRDIMRKWGKYWEGAEFVACQSCGGKARRYNPSVQSTGSEKSAVASAQNGGTGATLVEYVGKVIGSRRFRGPSGKRYTFGGSSDGAKYVLAEDLAHFQSMPDFHVLSGDEAETASEDAATTPAVIAEGTLA